MAKRTRRATAKSQRPTGKKAKTPKNPRRPKGPARRQSALPGMEQVRDQILDRECETIANARENMNALKQEEQTALATSLRRMQDRSTSTYVHAGVELARIPGSDKIRARLVKDSAEQTSAPETDTDEAEPATGTDGE